MGAFKHVFSSKKTKERVAKQAQKTAAATQTPNPNEPRPRRGDWRVVMHKDELENVWVAQPEHFWGSSWLCYTPNDIFEYSSYSRSTIHPIIDADKDKAFEKASDWTKYQKDLFDRRIEARRIARDTKEIHVIK